MTTKLRKCIVRKAFLSLAWTRKITQTGTSCLVLFFSFCPVNCEEYLWQLGEKKRHSLRH